MFNMRSERSTSDEDLGMGEGNRERISRGYRSGPNLC